ncbi:hypothetical protein K1T71_001286 [Dendrolimus kikuchii]|uniref:Uncharacterized protein n=1 Tax=Dendrolimus kikuchii TaxID=765133 RepID=A0ACC1DHN8_9NEOP|nr:hypothetical protein K1T71_001286 [Dendrolimus kikuchii]
MSDGGAVGTSGVLISAKNISEVLNNMKRGKSPGHDGLSVEHFKYAGVHLPRALAMLFNLCLAHSYLPKSLMRTRRTSVYACFLDLSKAFDLVAYDLLWNKLGDAGVPTDLVSILKFWYSNQTNQVRWAGTLSDEYRLECGYYIYFYQKFCDMVISVIHMTDFFFLFFFFIAGVQQTGRRPT